MELDRHEKRAPSSRHLDPPSSIVQVAGRSTSSMHGAVVWEYPRFEKKACASANMYARCDAKVTLPLALLAQALPQPGCAYHTHRLTEMQHWLVDEWACLTEWPVLLELRAQQQA